MITALYMRVSSNRQVTRSQEADLMTYKAACEGKGEVVKVYREKATGGNFNRAAWQRLWAAVQTGKVQRIAVWRLDRLGRTAGEMITLLDQLEARGVGFWSIRDGFDPSTPSGRLQRNILASVAQFETEVRRERQAAGIAAVRKANGGKCTWGGREVGELNKKTAAKVETVRQMRGQGKTIAEINRVVGLTRQTIYRLLGTE
jgi:DNA invertase Pin-like site-specific DNA recombinase